MANRIVGLELGRYSVKAVVLSTGFRTFELVEVAEELVEEPAAPAAPPEMEDGSAEETLPSREDGLLLSAGTLDALRRLRQRGVLDVDAIYTAVPRDFGYITPLVLPFQTPREVDAILKPQLDGKLPEEVDELMVDWMSGGAAAEGGFQLHTLAVQEERLASLLADLASVGIDPKVVDAEPFHLVTAGRLALQPAGEPVAVVDVGAERTGVVIFDGGRVDFARVVTGGGETITRALAEKFKLDVQRAREGKHRDAFMDVQDVPASAERSRDDALVADTCRDAVKPLVRRIRETLHAHLTATRREVVKVVLCGSSAALPGLAGYLGQSLGVPCEVFEARRPEFARLPDFAGVSHRFVGALGLALRAVPGQTGSQFNLRKGRFSFRGSYDFIVSQIPSLATAAVVLFVCAGLFFGSRVVLLRAEQAALDASLAELTEQTFGEAVMTPSSIRSRLAAVGQGPVLRPERSAYVYFDGIAATIDLLQGDGRWIEARSMEVDLGNSTFNITGFAAAAANVDALETELATVRCLTGIDRRDLTRDGERFRFSVQGQIDCSRAPVAAADDEEETDDGAAAPAPEENE